MRILLITGGWSGERQVAINGAKALQAAMLSLGHAVEWFDLTQSLSGLAEATRRNDVAFINLHGSPGEDGLVQAALDRLGFPYQGSGPAASMLALDKAAAKEFFRMAGLQTAPSVFLPHHPGADWQCPVPFPLFIKDNVGGSTVNLEYVETPADLPASLDRLFARGGAYLCEAGVKGIEITCGIIGELRTNTDGVEVEEPTALPPILIRATKGGHFDYESKYTAGGAEEICPAPIAPELTAKVQAMTLTAHRALGLSGYSRADFIIPTEGEGKDEPVILEINTLPGMTATSLIPQELAAVGVSFAQMVDKLVALGLARKARAEVCAGQCPSPEKG